MLKSQSTIDSTSYSLRILCANLGNASFKYRSWEYKLHNAEEVSNSNKYITAWQPDILLLSEVYQSAQMNTTVQNGPILPSSYSFACGKSIDRTTGKTAEYIQQNASHEHECIAWKTEKFMLVDGSEKSVAGRNDSLGKEICNYDFTGFRVNLVYKTTNDTITAIVVHPDSRKKACRIVEIENYWSQLAGNNTNVVIGGDWNTEDNSELQKPSNFQTVFSKGNYWGLRHNPKNHTNYFLLYGYRHLDHVYSNFGKPCTNCGSSYGTINLPHAVEVGGYNGHPRIDGGFGMDHRQILFDMHITSKKLD